LDGQLEDSVFIWHPETNFVHVTFDIFRKEKRLRKEDDEEENIKIEPKHSVIFKVKGSQIPPCLYLGHKLTQKCGGHKPLNTWYILLTVPKYHGHRRRNKVLLLFHWAWTWNKYRVSTPHKLRFVLFNFVPISLYRVVYSSGGLDHTVQ
jgi:hypothetical protein